MNISEFWEKAKEKGLPEDAVLLAVCARTQRVLLIENGSVRGSYPISTSRYGIGNAADSHKTPPGLHQVEEWIGQNEQIGRVFKGRVPQEEIWSLGDRLDDDLILTRILRLRGLEAGVNTGPGIDSYERYIYIHGTNHENDIGKPTSGGCVRMSNEDVIELFDLLFDRTVLCWILEGGIEE